MRGTVTAKRYRLKGRIEGRLFVVVYTPRRTATRIISARKANQREVKDDESRDCESEANWNPSHDD